MATRVELLPLFPILGRGAMISRSRTRSIATEEDGKSAEVLAELYVELRRLAGQLMRSWPQNGTVQPTALVHEACLKLFGSDALARGDRTHILALACTAMRSVLIDHARARASTKRRAHGERVALEGLAVAYEERAYDLLALNETLERLAGFDREMARAVELSFFGGLSLEETARELRIPFRTFERRWAATRAWLKAEMG